MSFDRLTDTELKRRARALDAAVRAWPNLIDRSDTEWTAYPGFATRASGAHVWDADGRRYLDFVMHFGSVVLGHANRAVNEAVIEEIERGVSRTLRSPAHVRLAELL